MYEESLKRKLVQEFIVENHRAPTPEQLRELMKQALKEMPALERVGFSSYEGYTVRIKDESSASQESKRRAALKADLWTINARIDRLREQMAEGYAYLNGSTQRLMRSLTALEGRMNNLVLSNSRADLFLYSVEEPFTVQDKVDLTNSTVSLESGYVTGGKQNYKSLDLRDVTFQHNVRTTSKIVSKKVVGELESLRKMDGKFWTAIVEMEEPLERVTVVLETSLPQKQLVTFARLAIKGIDTNKRMMCTVQYSVNGTDFSTLQNEIALRNGENEFSVGLEVRRLRFLISKDAADSIRYSSKTYEYCYELDSLELFSSPLATNESILYAGPYRFTNAEGQEVGITKLTLDWCGLEPEGTSVDWYVSSNGTDWVPALSVVALNSGERDLYALLDVDLGEDELISKPIQSLTVANDEALLNLYIPEASVERINLRSIVFKRNVPGEAIYGAYPGWYYDEAKHLYRTTFYVENPKGILMKLGTRSARIDGIDVVGDVTVKQGYHVFETHENNLTDIGDPSEYDDLAALKAADPLYPYNHKYIVEGFPYNDTFSGERLYVGTNEWFAVLGRYSPPELFSGVEAFTLEEIDGNLYFKVKVDKRDASWSQEKFSIDYTTLANTVTDVYVKAVLQTTNVNVTPRIDGFTMRAL